MSLKDEASMSSSIWVLAAGAVIVMIALLSQITDTATCYKIPGCMMFRHALGPGIHGIVD
jgi:hypothetical protein